MFIFNGWLEEGEEEEKNLYPVKNSVQQLESGLFIKEFKFCL
jgi:hypothetical protein